MLRPALIIGTGIDEAPEILCGRPTAFATRYGVATVIECRMQGRDIVVIPRHGLAHQTPPHLINHRANIAALGLMGVERVIGICAVGSLSLDFKPGDASVLTDIIDFTKGPPNTFSQSSGDCFLHCDVTTPYCPEITSQLLDSCKALGVPGGRTATYLGVSGPRYETPAEVRLFASWGADVVGMTNSQECILAREAGICYGAVAMITNMATGLTPQTLNHQEVREAMKGSVLPILEMALYALDGLSDHCSCNCRANAGKIAFE